MADTIFDTFGLDPLFWGSDSKLMQAISQKNYPAIYSLLRKVTRPLSCSDGLALCKAVIQSGCTLRVFQSILDACPPPEDFCGYVSFSSFPMGREYITLEQDAIKQNRSDILRLLLDRDVLPNDHFPELLETAVYSGDVSCTRLLLRQASTNSILTPAFYALWSMLGMDPKQDRCLHLVAEKILGRPIPLGDEIPLPPGLTVAHAACRENWPLLRRICREGTVTRKDGEAAVRCLLEQFERFSCMQLPELLDSLFTACPSLLRCHYPRYALAVGMLTGDFEGETLLRPHLKAMPGKQIPLFPDSLSSPCIDWTGSDGLLTHWDRVLGKEYIPVLKRSNRLCSSFFRHLKDHSRNEALEDLLGRCRITGKPVPGRVSPLAKEVLSHASPSLVAKLLEQDGLLALEDRAAAMEWCSDNFFFSNRAAILAYSTKEVNYDL